MKDEKLSDKMKRLAKKTDKSVRKNSYVIAIVDGNRFSQTVKHEFHLPFDDEFINIMNETAKFVCENLGRVCRCAYVQSDEISFLLTDVEPDEMEYPYNGRVCKLQSLIASWATSRFNQLMDMRITSLPIAAVDAREQISTRNHYNFDCKIVNMLTRKDAYNWFLYRQNDCVRNSKNQVAHTYYSQKEIEGLSGAELVEKLIAEKNIDWNRYNDGKKQGRLIFKEKVQCFRTINGTVCPFEMEPWTVHYSGLFSGEYGDTLLGLIPVKKHKKTTKIQ